MLYFLSGEWLFTNEGNISVSTSGALNTSERDSWHDVLQLYQNKDEGRLCTSKWTKTEADKDQAGGRTKDRSSAGDGVK